MFRLKAMHHRLCGYLEKIGRSESVWLNKYISFCKDTVEKNTTVYSRLFILIRNPRVLY